MANPSSNQVKQGAVIGGWICFALGVLIMYASVWTFLLYLPLFFVSFILSIIALAQKRIVSGMVLLLCCIVVPVVLWLTLSFTRAANFMDEHPPPIGENTAIPRVKTISETDSPGDQRNIASGSIPNLSNRSADPNREELIAKVHGQNISVVDAHHIQIAFRTVVDSQASGKIGPSLKTGVS